MGKHPGRTLGLLAGSALVVLAAIALVGAVAPDAYPVVLLVGVVLYLASIPVGYVVVRRRHW